MWERDVKKALLCALILTIFYLIYLLMMLFLLKTGLHPVVRRL